VLADAFSQALAVCSRGDRLGQRAFGFENATKPWREYPAFEYNDFPVPPDYQQKTEWAFARLMYPNTTNPNVWGIGVRRFRGYGGDWREGGRGIFWTMDYPRSDRHFSLAIRRLTRLDARSVEQPLNFDEGSQYDWPWLYAVEVGHWELTDEQAYALREYLLRGGFFMCDDFHGTIEWENFVASMRRVFPIAQSSRLKTPTRFFTSSTTWTSGTRCRERNICGPGRTYEQDGVTPRWRGIYDDKGRLMVQSATTWTWAIPGNTPTTLRSSPRSASA
jgi:hypothetical protein